jgi:hypothetical protein
LLHFGNPADLASPRPEALDLAMPADVRGIGIVALSKRPNGTWGERHPPDEAARRRGMLGNAKREELRARRGEPSFERRMGSDRYFM